MTSQLSGADVMLRTPSKLVRQSVRHGPVLATPLVPQGRPLLFGPPAAALPVLPGQPALGHHRPAAAAARPLPPEEDVLIVDLTEDEDRLFIAAVLDA